MQKYLDLLLQFLALLGVLSAMLGMLANVLPEGRLKTACSYAGLRLGKARQALAGALPAPKDGAK